MTHNIPGLAVPWVWRQPRTDTELIERLIQARDYMVHERERENLCSVAAGRLNKLLAEHEQLQALFWLAARDVIFLSDFNIATKKHDGCSYAVINCGDTFAWACADAQPLPAKRAVEFRRFYQRFGADAIVAWCAHERGATPLEKLRTDGYLKAKAALREGKP